MYTDEKIDSKTFEELVEGLDDEKCQSRFFLLSESDHPVPCSHKAVGYAIPSCADIITPVCENAYAQIKVALDLHQIWGYTCIHCHARIEDCWSLHRK